MAELTNLHYTGFDDWQDVANHFCDNYDLRGQKALLLIPEPDEVLLASYGGGCYDGDAVVSYRNGDKFYVVKGSHCSCYGLEGQWEPEEYTKDLFIAMLEKKIDKSDDYTSYPSWSKGTWKFILDQVKDK